VPRFNVGEAKVPGRKPSRVGLTKEPKPQLVEMAPQKVAAIKTKGDPNKVASKIMPALYGSVYRLKFERKKHGGDFKVGPLRARWPDAPSVPKAEWTGVWALPVPSDTTDIPQKVPELPVELQTWEYGLVAQVTHIGPYRTEKKTVERLRRFIREEGYEISGDHEEEYITRPDARVQKTIIRYPVRKA